MVAAIETFTENSGENNIIENVGVEENLGGAENVEQIQNGVGKMLEDAKGVFTGGKRRKGTRGRKGTRSRKGKRGTKGTRGKKDTRGNKKKAFRKKGPSRWIAHVKAFCRRTGKNFPQALKDPLCKKTFKFRH
tara:strand:- start:3424 stop:3822 length:399 start_codon:yes stop_codon:yes gene_type:complete